MRYLINGGLVYDETLNCFKRKDILTQDEKITELIDGEQADNGQKGQTISHRLENSDEEVKVIDATGKYVIPGLIDIHTHGCHNSDFCDASQESIADFLAYEASCGITAICPTTMTVPEEQLLRVATEAGIYKRDVENHPENHEQEAFFAGINMEGPFISPAKKGSQEESDIKPCDISFVRKMNELSEGSIKLVDIAPEMDGAMEFIRESVDAKESYVISVAHTNADYETALTAMKMGAHHVTHLFNAMTPYTHREPGVIGAASDDPDCYAEIICDGIHIRPIVVRNTFKIFGQDHMVLISDSMRATGMPDGEYELGGHKVFVRGKRATLENGTIAASVTNLFDCMKTCVKEMDLPLETAVRAATVNAAKSIGIYDQRGSLECGKAADILVIDQETLDLEEVLVRGRLLG